MALCSDPDDMQVRVNCAIDEALKLHNIDTADNPGARHILAAGMLISMDLMEAIAKAAPNQDKLNEQIQWMYDSAEHYANPPN